MLMPFPVYYFNFGGLYKHLHVLMVKRHIVTAEQAMDAVPMSHSTWNAKTTAVATVSGGLSQWHWLSPPHCIWPKVYSWNTKSGRTTQHTKTMSANKTNAGGFTIRCISFHMYNCNFPTLQ